MKATRFALIFLWLACMVAHAADQTAHLVILHVNDIHGHTQGQIEEGKSVGGYARLATAVQQIRDEAGADNVLLFHAGDEFARGDEMTIATAGAANIALMNSVGVNLLTPGNGEFYGGLANLQRRIAEATFPVLASNVSYRLGDDPLAQNFAMLEAGGIKVGVIGLCFVRKEHPSALPLAVADPESTAKKLVPELRKRADLVIALNHLGLETDRRLAASVAGLDLIVGGHSHTTLPQGNRVIDPDGKSVLIVQAGEYLRYLGRVDLDLTKSAGRWEVTEATARLIKLDASIPEDPAIKAQIARMWPTTRPAAKPGQREASSVQPYPRPKP